MVLDLLASGELSLTSVRLIRRHLTPENHAAVLAQAKGRTREEIEILVATLAPQRDARSLVRKLPTAEVLTVPAVSMTEPAPAAPALCFAPAAPPPPIAAPLAPTRRPIIETTSPERYRVQFAIGKESHDKLRRVQDLLRREIPDGDPGLIFDRAITLLLAQVENRKVGVTPKPRSRAPIRPGTDTFDIRTPPPPSRYLPRAVKRAVWERDGDQCAFSSPGGRRCTERTYLQFHHVQAYAKQGPATVENLSLRCRRHNEYEADLVFGSRGTSSPARRNVSP